MLGFGDHRSTRNRQTVRIPIEGGRFIVGQVRGNKLQPVTVAVGVPSSGQVGRWSVAEGTHAHILDVVEIGLDSVPLQELLQGASLHGDFGEQEACGCAVGFLQAHATNFQVPARHKARDVLSPELFLESAISAVSVSNWRMLGL